MHPLYLLVFAHVYIITFTIITCYVLHVIIVYNIEVIAYNLCTYLYNLAIPCLVFAILCSPFILVDGWIRAIENTD